MSPHSVVALARGAIAKMVAYLLSVPTHWFSVNPSDHCRGFSLCSCFGLTVRYYEALLVVANLLIEDVAGCRILQREWDTYLKSGHFVVLEAKDNPRAHCIHTKRTDFQAPIEFRDVSEDRFKRVYVHAVQIGAKVPNRTVHSRSLVQKDANGKLIQIAPRL